MGDSDMATGRRGKGEGSIYRRRDGQWVGSADIGLQNGRRRRKAVYGKTKRKFETSYAPSSGPLTPDRYRPRPT